MRVAVVGGTGLVGRHVVDRLHELGHATAVLARSSGVDLATGAGLEAALAGAEAVIDVVNVRTLRREVAVEFFSAAARNLADGAARSGVQHLICLSIVGIDVVGTGYYEGKQAQERVLRGSAVPVTVLRATQFHEFAGQVLARGPAGPLALVPRMRIQPIAAREVAAALVDLVSAPPAGRVELAGPAEEQLVDMARRLLAARGSRRLVVPVRLPGPGGKAMAAGSALPSAPGLRGTTTFAEWLAGHDARVWL